MAKFGEIVVMSPGGTLKPVGTDGSTFGKAGAYGRPGTAVSVKNAGEPLLRRARRYWSVCGGS